MVKYGINGVFALSYDAGFNKFSLILCIGNGEITLKIFDVNEFGSGETFATSEFYKLLEAIHSEI